MQLQRNSPTPASICGTKGNSSVRTFSTAILELHAQLKRTEASGLMNKKDTHNLNSHMIDGLHFCKTRDFNSLQKVLTQSSNL